MPTLLKSLLHYSYFAQGNSLSTKSGKRDFPLKHKQVHTYTLYEHNLQGERENTQVRAQADRTASVCIYVCMQKEKH